VAKSHCLFLLFATGNASKKTPSKWTDRGAAGGQRDKKRGGGWRKEQAA